MSGETDVEKLREAMTFVMLRYFSEIWRKNVFLQTAFQLNARVNEIKHVRQFSAEHGAVKLYCGPLAQQIKAVKLFSLVTSAGGLVAQPYIIHHASAFENLSVTIAVLGIIGCFTYVTPFLLHAVAKKYVIDLTYKPENDMYAAVVYTFFLRKKEILFRPEDIDVPEVPGMFTTFHVRGIPLFVDPRIFVDKSHYARIMGYDKPLDLKLGKSDDGKKET